MSDNRSRLERLKDQPEEIRKQWLQSLTPQQQINVLHDLYFVGRRQQQLPPENVRNILALCGRGWGKEIDVDAPVLTFNRGWTTNGELRAGDVLYGHEGQTTIVEAHPIRLIDDAYELTFRNGEKIKASGTHLWTTINGYQFNKHKVSQGNDYRPAMKTLTTKEMFDSSKHKNRYANHKIPTVNAQGGNRVLPVDPYVLGLWLGDGTSSASYITIGDQDHEETKQLLSDRGIAIQPLADPINYKLVPTIRPELNQLGVLNNKHIPDIYLTASYQQRLDLLRGLMDSDGHICATHHFWCEITQKNQRLSEDITTLISTLGVAVKQYQLTAKLGDYQCPVTRIHFKPPFNPFLLPRKATIYDQQPPQTQQWRQMFNDVVAIEKCEPTYMRCLTVDSEDRLYAVGRTMILTHNTFFGSHVVNHWARTYPGCRIALVGETVADVRDVMVRGESGIIAKAHPSFKPEYTPSVRKLEWSNGSTAQTFSGEEPDQLRGPQFQFALVDELAKMQYQEEVWDMLMMCLRLGKFQQVVVTTTPRPTKLIKQLAADEDTMVITGSTYENTSLPPSYLNAIKKRFEGTRLGQQELYGKILADNPNALWVSKDIDQARITSDQQPTYGEDEDKQVSYERVVVAIDPATTSNENSDETGIIVAGVHNDHAYILEDGSIKGTPNEWAEAAVKLYHKHQADIVVGEANNGGDMIEAVIKNVDRNVNYTKVTATRGKARRAEPITGLYEQQRVHHVGVFHELEEQMLGFDPTLGDKQKSPDRMDALVWALTELFLNETDLVFEIL